MIIIPMAGLSERFKKHGYKVPKFMLKAHGSSIFYFSILSFKKYFDTEKFVFITLKNKEIESFVEDEIKKLGLKKYEIICLDFSTRGQAETVYKGLLQINAKEHEEILIFNIDTIRPNFSIPSNFKINEVDGYLETFIGSGKNWSNILPLNCSENKVMFVAEKKEISEYCCTGIYYWKKILDFKKSYSLMIKDYQNNLLSEYYIAPMYNFALKLGKDIRFNVIQKEEVYFCGTPIEYQKFLLNELPISLFVK